jgi:ankyrin repeat protein
MNKIYIVFMLGLISTSSHILYSTGRILGVEDLVNAAKKGDKERLQMLLDNGWHAACIDHYGRLPLVEAARNAKKDMVEFLLSKGARINDTEAQKPNFYTPLMVAVAAGNEEITEQLLKAGANTEIKNIDGKTVYDVAKETGPQKTSHLDMLKKVLSRIAQSKIPYYNNAVFTAIENGDLKQLEKLAQLVTLNMQDDRGNTPLHKAVDKNDLALVQFILANAPSTLAIKNNAGQTPVDLAVSRHTILQFLVSAHKPT